MSEAAEAGRLAIATALRACGAPVDAVPGGRYSPLESAVRESRLEMSTWLIDNGAKVENPERPSILMSLSPVSSNDELFDLLLERGLKIDRLKERAGQVLYGICARQDGSSHQLKLLLESGFNPNCRYGHGELALLHVAAITGNLPAVNLLLAFGADPEARDGEGAIPLHHAAINGRLDVMHALLPHCQEINGIATADGYAPIHVAARAEQSKELELLLLVDLNRP
jgi:ankyrin repeat protein